MSENLKEQNSKIERELKEREKEFDSSVSPEQKKVIKEIKGIIETIDLGPDSKGFNSWNSERLVSAREKLARYSEFLGEWISYHETRSDFAYIWRKGKIASDWQPMKKELNDGLKGTKTTNPEIENVLTEKYLSEQYFSMFHRRRADYLILFLESIDRMIKSIDSRLIELSRQQRLNSHD